ncbi:MAG: glutamine-hydrolyzing carbamoyl-phosphate synthase small subunit [Promethearchaeota archaeon]
MERREAVLALSNGKIFHGYGFGATTKIFGELVFTTFTAAGYNNALTDPSNQGQIYILTYPLVGNYGVPSPEKDEFGIAKHFESDSIKCAGFVVHEACNKPSHGDSSKNLDQYLSEQNIPGIEGIDTRELTKIIRSEGVQIGMLEVYEPGKRPPSDSILIKELKNAKDPNQRHLVKEVSIKEPKIFEPDDPLGTVVCIDCGIKNNILRNLISRNMRVVLVPFNFTFEKIMKFNPDGVLISNGPGDPKKCVETIHLAKKLIKESFPTMGICLGHQILCLAAGGDTYKMKFGHRGGNKPVIDIRTGKAYITSQNHGYAVKVESLSKTGFSPFFENPDDQTNEGIYHAKKPIFSVQFHPEGHPGPEDTTYLFDDFLKNIAFKAFKEKKNFNGGNV